MRPNTVRVPSIPTVRTDSEKIKTHLQARRRNINEITLTLSFAAMAFGLVWLAWILWTTFSLGVDDLSMSLFAKITPAPNTPGGGLTSTIASSLLLVDMATLIGTPLGILAGVYLAEYGKTSILASATRFINGVLLSAPSIVIGLFIYAVVVTRMQYFSGVTGVIALVLLQIPIVVRTTENMLSLVPSAIRGAAMALGTPKWKMTLSITLKASCADVITGVLLAAARIADETTPLLFVALNNQFQSLDPNQPVAALSTVIFKFAMNPFPGWQQLAWAGVFLITLGVLGLNVLARALFTKK